MLLRALLVTNGIQLGGILLLWHLSRQRDLSTCRWESHHSTLGEPYRVKTTDGGDDDDAYGNEDPIPLEQFRFESPETDSAAHSPSSREPISVGTDELSKELSSNKRGMLFGVACAVLVAAAWILFFITAWLRMRPKSERGSDVRNSIAYI